MNFWGSLKIRWRGNRLEKRPGPMLRERGLNRDFTIFSGMRKADVRRKQGDVAVGQDDPRTIFAVADERVADGGELRADLVMPAGMQLYAQEAQFVRFRKHLIT